MTLENDSFSICELKCPSHEMAVPVEMWVGKMRVSWFWEQAHLLRTLRVNHQCRSSWQFLSRGWQGQGIERHRFSVDVSSVV